MFDHLNWPKNRKEFERQARQIKVGSLVVVCDDCGHFFGRSGDELVGLILRVIEADDDSDLLFFDIMANGVVAKLYDDEILKI